MNISFVFLISSFACTLVVITLSVLPFIIFQYTKKFIVFLICFIPITSLFLFSFLRYNNKETQTYSNQLTQLFSLILNKKKSEYKQRNTHLKN